MIVTDPIPRASVRTATPVNPGAPARVRAAVLQVASSVLQPHKRPRVALNEPGLLNPSECAAGRGARVGGRQPASEKALLEHRQVCGNFPGELTLGPPRPDGVVDP